MKYIFALAALCVSSFAFETTTRRQSSPVVIEKNGWRRTEIMDPSPLVRYSKNIQTDERSNEVAIESASRGWAFKAAEPEDINAMCINACESGSPDCFTFHNGCNNDCENCVRAFECVDSRKERCNNIIEYPCLQGDWVCVPANNGIRIKKGDPPSRDADGITVNGFFTIFKKQNCGGDSFNMLPCNDKEEQCRAVEPCSSDDMSCCELVPNML